MGILRSLFGPSKAEIWEHLAHEQGGVYEKGGFLGTTKVHVDHGEWTITLDTYTVSSGNTSSTYTRLRAPFVNADGFRFTIYREGVFSGIGKAFGMQDIEVGHPTFDDAFVIKGNSTEHLCRLFASSKVRALISTQPDIHLEVKDDEGWFGASFPEGVDELYFSAHGVIKDLDRLKSLYELFAEVLDQLCQMGSAYENDPSVRL